MAAAARSKLKLVFCQCRRLRLANLTFTSVSLRVSSVSPALPMLELSSQPVALKSFDRLVMIQTFCCGPESGVCLLRRLV